MAKSRIDLHYMLCDLLGSNQVYFRAPEGVRMIYPALVYDFSRFKNIYADDKLYNSMNAYTITAIYPDPDDDLPRRLMQLPYCRFDRHYVSDNLNHDVFTLLY